MTRKPLFLLVPLALVLGGCAEITPPTPQEVLESPFGKGPLRLGMTKDEVRSIWGDPDTIEKKSEDQWGAVRELWTYEAKLQGIVPINVGYASKSKYLEFEGNNLVTFYE